MTLPKDLLKERPHWYVIIETPEYGHVMVSVYFERKPDGDTREAEKILTEATMNVIRKLSDKHV